MDSYQTDRGFSFLAEETMQLTEMFGPAGDEVSTPPQGNINSSFINNPGLVYRIEKGISTFCIRGLPVENIARFYDLCRPGSDLATKLRLDGEQCFTRDLLFFSTRSLSLAEIIHDQLIDRRYLFQEEFVCNVSDPGLCWWMECFDDGFTVYFKHYFPNRASNLIKLGPVGDSAIAGLRFKEALRYLKQIITISEFACDENSLTIKIPDTSPSEGLDQFKKLFLEGGEMTGFENLIEADNTLGYYLKELAAIRRFWREVENCL